MAKYIALHTLKKSAEITNLSITILFLKEVLK
jgi:hypothetical protein